VAAAALPFVPLDHNQESCFHEIVALVTGKRSRPRVGLILVLFVAPLSAQGLCFMPVAAAPSSTSPPEHDCCKQGLQALPPACCMTSLAVEAAARIAKGHRSSAPTITVGLLDPTPVAGGALQRRRLLHSHGDPHLADPPPLALRI
jgi:hypothetical protein